MSFEGTVCRSCCSSNQRDLNVFITPSFRNWDAALAVAGGVLVLGSLLGFSAFEASFFCTLSILPFGLQVTKAFECSHCHSLID